MIFDMTKRTGGGGGGYSIDEIALQDFGDDVVLSSATTIRNSFTRSAIKTIRGDLVTSLATIDTFRDCQSLVSAIFPNLVSASENAFMGCNNITTLHFDKIESCYNYSFKNMAGLTTIVFPKWRKDNYQGFMNDSLLQYFDIGTAGRTVSGNFTAGECFRGCSSLNVIILRDANVRGLSGTNVFTNTPFANGGTGGAVYIPKSLYDHLGDGTPSDYKAASNWSTIDGYGTITWAKIEGSYYETHYADGTAVPT